MLLATQDTEAMTKCGNYINDNPMQLNDSEYCLGGPTVSPLPLVLP